MANQKLPEFLSLDGEAAIYNKNDESQLLFYIPEVFFDDSTKNPIAKIDGELVTCLGLFNWNIISKTGVLGKYRLFNFPTMISCKPYEIDTVRNFALGDNIEPDNYKILKFRYGDEVIHQIHVPQLPDNVDLFYKLAVISSKIPNTIDYKDGWRIFIDNATLNGINYKMPAQAFGILWSELCRDPDDISKPYRLSKYIYKDPYAYKAISIKMNPKYISPYTALISENFDEGLMAADILSTKSDKELLDSPLEKIVMM